MGKTKKSARKLREYRRKDRKLKQRYKKYLDAVDNSYHSASSDSSSSSDVDVSTAEVKVAPPESYLTANGTFYLYKQDNQPVFCLHGKALYTGPAKSKENRFIITAPKCNKCKAFSNLEKNREVFAKEGGTMPSKNQIKKKKGNLCSCGFAVDILQTSRSLFYAKCPQWTCSFYQWIGNEKTLKSSKFAEK